MSAPVSLSLARRLRNRKHSEDGFFYSAAAAIPRINVARDIANIATQQPPTIVPDQWIIDPAVATRWVSSTWRIFLMSTSGRKGFARKVSPGTKMPEAVSSLQSCPER